MKPCQQKTKINQLVMTYLIVVDDKQDLVNAMSTFDASWKVLGLMLNMSDSFLESIDHSISKDSPQLTAFCEYWINSGLAYWAILVDTLKSPLLGEEELADEININHLSKSLNIVFSYL